MKSDPEFYEYARAHPRAFLTLLLGKPPSPSYHVSSLELKTTSRRIDLGFVAEPDQPGSEAWLVECHGYVDPGIERKLYLKSVLAADQLGLWGRIRAGVVYTTSEVAEAALAPRLGPPGHAAELSPVRVVLDHVLPDQLLDLSPELFPLLPLSRVTRSALQRGMAGWWEKVGREVRDQSVRSSLEEMFFRFCASRFPGDRMRAIAELLEAVMDITRTRVGKDLMEKGRSIGLREGKREGKKEGKREGKKEGKKEGLRKALKRVMETRFGPVPDDIAGEIAGCERSARLEALLRHAAIDPDLDTLRGRL